MLWSVDDLSAHEAPTLQYLYVSLSNLCNAHCSYCDVHEQPAPTRVVDEEKLRELFEGARAMGCQVVHFLGGGEPLIARRFPVAARLCAELGLRVVVTTNGSHLTRRLNDHLVDVELDTVILSIDSHHPEVHDRIRGMRRLFDRASEGVRLLHERHPDCGLVINHVVTGDNVGALDDFLEWCASVGATALNLLPVKDCPSLAIPTPAALTFAARMPVLRARAEALGIHLMCHDAHAQDWAWRQMGRDSVEEYRCVYPSHALYIDCPTGKVYPCDCTIHREPSSTFELGDIWADSLQSIWDGAAAVELREVLASPCDPGCKADCDFANMKANERLLRGADVVG